MSRVANHDNDLVNTLKDKLETCNEKKAQLEKQQESLSKQQSDQQAKKDEFSTALMDLQDTYSETSDAQEQMEREKKILFVTRSDTETLVNGLEAYGPALWSSFVECLPSPSGMRKKKN